MGAHNNASCRSFCKPMDILLALVDHFFIPRCAEVNNFNNFAKSTPFQSATGAMSYGHKRGDYK